jgi:hypothetical protein
VLVDVGGVAEKKQIADLVEPDAGVHHATRVTIIVEFFAKLVDWARPSSQSPVVEAEGAPAFWPWRQVLRSPGVDPDAVLTGRVEAPDDRFRAFEM